MALQTDPEFRKRRRQKEMENDNEAGLYREQYQVVTRFPLKPPKNPIPVVGASTLPVTHTAETSLFKDCRVVQVPGTLAGTDRGRHHPRRAIF